MYLMPSRMTNALHHLMGVFFTVVLLGNVSGQVQNLDPSDMFFATYNYEKDGKHLLEQKSYNEAINKFDNAKKLLNTIHVRFPRWNPEIVAKAHTRVSKLIEKVGYEKELDEKSKATQPQLFEEVSKTPRLDKVKRQAQLALQNNTELPTAAERIKHIQKNIEQREQELEGQKLAAANRSELLKIIKDKDAELIKLKQLSGQGESSASKREALLKDEIAALRKQLPTSSGQASYVAQEEELQKRQQEIETLQQKVLKFEEERAQLIQANEENMSMAKRSSEEIAALKAVINESAERLESETIASNRKINEINKTLATLEAEKKDALQKLNTVSSKIDEKSIADASAEKDSDDLLMLKKLKSDAAEIDQQKKELLAKKELEIVTIRERENKLNTSLLDAQKQLESANQAIRDFEAQTQAKDDQILALKSQLNDMSAEQQKTQQTVLAQADVISKLETGLEELKQERDLLLMRPLKTEVLALQENLALVNREKQSLSTALSTNEEKYFEAIDRIELLQKELEGSRGVTSQFEKNVEAERELSNEIISSQRERLASQQKMLNETQRALAVEQAKAEKLQELLTQTSDQYAELNDKHESLIAEHEHLRTLMDGKSDVEVLKRQHLAMKSGLISTQKAYQALREQTQVQEQDLAMARKQYALARTDLNKARHQLELSNMRADKLRNQLIQAQSELQLASTNPSSEYSEAEIRVLRELVEKQLKLQKKRQLARSIILEQVKRLNIDDTEFIRALDLSETQELQLTKEQKELLANQDADGEFRFAERATPEERELAEAELSRKLKIYDKMGREAFEKGRFAAAEEFFKLNLDAHPGHVPSMLNLGVLQLRHAKNEGDISVIPEAIETFEDAIAMSGDQTVPYAHQMLGYAHFLVKGFEEASAQFQLAIKKDPTNANAHILLADIASEKNELQTSESHLKTAMKIDGTMSEPHFNLAKLYAHQGKYKQALTQYRAALRKGASPDSALESKLQQALPSDSF